MIRSFILLFVLVIFTKSFINYDNFNLVKNNYWHIAGPAKESQENINISFPLSKFYGQISSKMVYQTENFWILIIFANSIL
jgi:hypothetical protein